MKDSKTIQLISDLKKKFPFVGKSLFIGTRILYGFKFLLDTTILKLKYWRKYGKIDFNKTCYVHPEKIQYFIKNRRYFNWNNSFRIMDGDWDLNKEPIDDLLIISSIKQRFVEGKKWEEIEIFNLIPTKQSKVKKIWTFKNEEVRDKYLKEIDSFYLKIKMNGYKSQKELYSFKERIIQSEWKPILDEIVVAIDRDGQLLFINGKHRLGVAKVLNIPKIPIIFLLRHKKWMIFRKNLTGFSKTLQGRKLYQNPIHPDLQDIPYKYGELSYNIIKKNLLLSQGTFLDINANIGYFCHKFEDDGFECYAAEKNQNCLYFLKKLKKAENKRFEIISESIFNYKGNQELNFNVILALNIFRDFMTVKEMYIKLAEFLKRLNVQEMFIGLDKPSRFRSKKYHLLNEPEKILKFILEKSSLNEFKYIGELEDGRHIYKLTSDKSYNSFNYHEIIQDITINLM